MNRKTSLPDFLTDKDGRFDVVLNLDRKVDAVMISSKWSFDYELRCDGWQTTHEVWLELEVLDEVTGTRRLNCQGR
jgi:hypothetical protein